MNCGIIGMPGTGKTIMLTWLGMNFYDQKFNIFSNFKIINPATGEKINKDIKSTEDLENAHDGILLIDEIMTYIDGRRSNTKMSQLVNNTLTKNRKRNLSLYYTSQDLYAPDIRLRLNTDYILLPEVKYIYEGQELHFKQDLIHPVNMDCLLPIMQVHASLLPANRAFGQKEILQKFVLNEYKVNVAQIAPCYDTSEEIDDLTKNSDDKGEKFERDCLDLLRKVHPEFTWIKPENSGQGQPTFDLEGWYNDELILIIDCAMSEARLTKSKTKSIHLFKLGDKPRNKFKEIEELRHCKTKFMTNIDDKVFIFPTSYIIDSGKASKSIEAMISSDIAEYVGVIS